MPTDEEKINMHDELVAALELIARGSLDDMRQWLLVVETEKNLTFSPSLVLCNRDTLRYLVARTAHIKAKEKP